MGKGRKPWIDRKHSTTYRLVYKSQSEESKDAIITPQFIPKKPLDKRELKKNPALRTFLQNSPQQNSSAEFDDDDLDEELIKQFADASDIEIEEEYEDDGEDFDKFDDASEQEEEEEEEEEEAPEFKKKVPPSFNQQTSQEGRKRLKYRADDYEYGDLGFPDDGYDYSQHLKKHDDEGVFIAIKGKPTALEKKLFAPTKLEQVAQPNVNLEEIDPEILEALNQDFDDADENAKEVGDLPDDFVEVAGGEDETLNKEDDFFKPPKDEVKISKTIKKKIGKKIELPPAQNYTDASDGTSLNERFAVVADTYNDDEIGDLEGEEIGGTINVNTLTDIFDEFEESQKLVNPFEGTHETPLIPKPVAKDAHGRFFEVLAAIKERSGDQNETEEVQENEDVEEKSQSEDDYELIEVQVKKDWDCESVVSSFTTNTENHPRLIKEPPKGAFKISLSKKTGIPIGVLPPPRSVKKNVEKVSLTKLDSRPDPSLLVAQPHQTQNSTGKGHSKKSQDGTQEEEEDQVSVTSTASSIRPPNETPEERKLRKQLTKQARKQNRERKKDLKTKYHQENLRLRTIAAQQPLQHASITPIH